MNRQSDDVLAGTGMSDSGLTRRAFLKNCAILGGATSLTPSLLWAGAQPKVKPNIVFILTDDQLREAFGCYGNEEALTPNVDRLAAGGVRFTRASVTSSVCAPSRISCLTGRYAGRFMAYVLNTGAHLPVTEPTVASVLKAAGYRTGFIGKVHFRLDGLRGVPTKDLQRRLGRIGFTSVPSAHYTRFKTGDHLKHQEKDFNAAAKFITDHKDSPFALFLFTTLTHGPTEAPQKYIDMVTTRRGNRTGKAMYLWLDHLVGRLVGTVDKMGIRDRTAIFYAGDNAPSGRGKGSRNKGTLYDGWVPQVVSWPGHVKEGLVVDEVVQNIDFLPTVLDICGAAAPAGARPDGMSLLPLMTGKNVTWREEAFFEVESGRAVRTDQWKYIAFRPVKGMWRKFEKQLGAYGGERDLLFDLKSDPGEKKNLFKDAAHAGAVKEMQARLRRLCAGYGYAFGEFGGGGST